MRCLLLAAVMQCSEALCLSVCLKVVCFLLLLLQCISNAHFFFFFFFDSATATTLVQAMLNAVLGINNSSTLLSPDVTYGNHNERDCLPAFDL